MRTNANRSQDVIKRRTEIRFIPASAGFNLRNPLVEPATKSEPTIAGSTLRHAYRQLPGSGRRCDSGVRVVTWEPKQPPCGD
jgi:hypothetical protein